MPVPAVTTSAGKPLYPPDCRTRWLISSAGSLNLLEDEDKDVRVYALQHLLAIVPQFWAEISDKLPLLFVSCMFSVSALTTLI